jgi:hypothetical protein
MGHKFVAIFITPRTAVRFFQIQNFVLCKSRLIGVSSCDSLQRVNCRYFLLCHRFSMSLAVQLLKKGSTGLIVGNARANICLISGAAS